MELHGILWKPHGVPWKLHGITWSSMEAPWNYMELHGSSVEFHGVILHGLVSERFLFFLTFMMNFNALMEAPWSSMGFHGNHKDFRGVPLEAPWKPMESIEVSWNIGGVPWKLTEFHCVTHNSLKIKE